MQASWQYNEFQSVGRDYADPVEVEVYEPSHRDFRNLEAEADATLDLLALEPGATVIDFGSGTGAFVIRAARRGLNAHGIDVSPAMLAYARRKAEGLKGATFHHAGFLSYEAPEQTADGIATTFAFHHLPDFWKGVALERLFRLLKPGGRLYLRDVVMPEHTPLEHIASFIARQEAAGGDFLREDAEGHFREEFSTYDWVMEGLLKRAGFVILKKETEAGVLVTYLCCRE